MYATIVFGCGLSVKIKSSIARTPNESKKPHRRKGSCGGTLRTKNVNVGTCFSKKAVVFSGAEVELFMKS